MSLHTLYSTLNLFNPVEAYNTQTKNEAEKAACPLFLKTNPGYENANKKLMIFGQETNGWLGPYSRDVSVDRIMKEYEDFFSGKYCYSYGGHFWNEVKNFINKLQQKMGNKSVDYMWNNIVKMGYNGANKNFPTHFYESIVKPNLNELINKEICILKPDYIIFFTGPDYDHVLNDVFKNPKRETISGFEQRELCKIVIPNVKKAFRLYHPKHLCFQGRPKIDKYYDSIIEEIAK